MAYLHALVNSRFAKNPLTWSWLTPSFCDGGVTLCRAEFTVYESRWRHPCHELVFAMELALKEHIISAKPCSVPSHKLSTYSLSHYSMQLNVVIEPTTYPTGTFDHCFVVRKLSNWLQHQIDGMSKARLPHNLILLTHQHACLLIIWSIVSHDLHYMFVIKLNDHFFNLL
jgi:hypothetical protein